MALPVHYTAQARQKYFVLTWRTAPVWAPAAPCACARPRCSWARAPDPEICPPYSQLNRYDQWGVSSKNPIDNWEVSLVAQYCSMPRYSCSSSPSWTDMTKEERAVRPFFQLEENLMFICSPALSYSLVRSTCKTLGPWVMIACVMFVPIYLYVIVS